MHVVGGHSIDQRMSPGRVIGDTAAKGGSLGGGRVRTELQVVRRQGSVESIQYDPGLDFCRQRIRVDLVDLVEITRAVQDQRSADGLARQAGACPACQDRDFEFGGCANNPRKVICMFRKDHSDGLNLIN